MTVLFTQPHRRMPYGIDGKTCVRKATSLCTAGTGLTVVVSCFPVNRWQRAGSGSLPHAGRLSGVLQTATPAEGWRVREGAIVAAAR